MTTYREALQAADRAYFENLVRSTRKVKDMARVAGLHRSTLHKHLERLGLVGASRPKARRSEVPVRFLGIAFRMSVDEPEAKPAPKWLRAPQIGVKRHRQDDAPPGKSPKARNKRRRWVALTKSA